MARFSETEKNLAAQKKTLRFLKPSFVVATLESEGRLIKTYKVRMN